MNDALLLDIGNSFTRIARFRAGAVGPAERHPTASLLAPEWTSALLAANPRPPCLAATVVPAVRDLLAERTRLAITWFGPELVGELDLSLVEPSTVGADRLANAVAAVHELPLPAIVLDCGTAITTEIVDAERRFRGGAIMPGRELSRQALARGTAQLPVVEAAAERPRAIGRNTREALLAGLDLGVLGAVERLLAASRAELGQPDAGVTVVGGDAEFFLRHLDGVAAGPVDFTLRGLGRAAAAL